MVDIELVPVDEHNWRRVMLLDVTEAQQGFVMSNLYSLAQAAYEPDYFPMAITADGREVGFVMLKLDEVGDYPLWTIARLMIDRFSQGRGYGRAALTAIIDYLRDEEAADGVLVSYVPENAAAARLYARLGFVDEGLTWEDETLVVLRF